MVPACSRWFQLVPHFNMYKKVHSVRHTSFNFYLGKLCKRPEVNSKPTHFLTFMNNGQTFPSFNGMVYSYQCSEQLQLHSGNWKAKRHWISGDTQKSNLLENNPNNTKINMKSQIKNNKNR